jgi:hypothetical protein
MARYFSVHAALDIAKAVVFAEFATCVMLFSLKRLDNQPSTPVPERGAWDRCAPGGMIPASPLFRWMNVK